MKNLIGVMQGRLLPKYQGRYQAHPVDYWQDEFLIAKKIGLDCIEFILDFNEASKNPLLTKDGISEILDVSKKTGVLVKTICADYFMEAPLHSKDKKVVDNSLTLLQKLINSAIYLGVKDIVIPCVDQSSLDNLKAINQFVNQVKNILPIMEKNNINLSLETLQLIMILAIVLHWVMTLLKS